MTILGDPVTIGQKPAPTGMYIEVGFAGARTQRGYLLTVHNATELLAQPYSDAGASSTTVEEFAFADKRIKTIDLSDCPGLTSLAKWAFRGFYMLESLILPPNLASIGAGVFRYDSNLTSIILPASLTSINASAFSDCGLTDIYVPWAEGEVAGAPWGATGASIHYNHTEEEST